MIPSYPKRGDIFATNCSKFTSSSCEVDQNGFRFKLSFANCGVIPYPVSRGVYTLVNDTGRLLPCYCQLNAAGRRLSTLFAHGNFTTSIEGDKTRHLYNSVYA